MERLTTISDNQIRVKDVRQGVFQDQTGIDNAFKKLAKYENIGTVKEFRDAKLAQVLLVPELQKENKELKHELEKENEQLRKENEELKKQSKQLAVEKLEQLLKFILNSKWTNIELCVSHSPLKIIRNKINEMVNELKGE